MQEQDLQQYTAWRVFLRHQLLQRDLQASALQVCCQLLCCSQTMVGLVHSTCSGRLQACIPGMPAVKPHANTVAHQQWTQAAIQHGKALGSWLRKHAVLLHSLELSTWPEQEVVVAEALSTAARLPMGLGLPLKAFSCTSISSGHMLRALAGAQLTELSLTLQLQGGSAQAAHQCRAALASFSHLQRLCCTGAWCASHPLPVLGPALQHLTQLTQLLLPRVLLDPDSVQLFPTSLKQLKVCCHTQPLQLQHLSALQHLHLEQELHVAENLPQSVQELQLGGCKSVRPLLALPQLQWLKVDSDLTGDQLQDLSRMKQLQHLELTYLCQRSLLCQVSTLATAARQFGSVPLKVLKVLGHWGCGQLPASAVAELGACTGLTSLSLHDLVLEETPQQLSRQLCQLPLQRLELKSVQWQQEGGEGVDTTQAASLEPLLQALGQMPSLRELLWSGVPSGPVEAAIRVAAHAATHLTAVYVGGDDVNDEVIVMPKCCTSRVC